VIHLTLSGSPYQIGYQHGLALRVLVDAMVRYESRRHSHTTSTTPNLDAVLSRVRNAAPALLEELEGIANGSGIPLDALLEVNLRVLHYCTVVAFADSDVGPLLGKNLDFAAYTYQVLFTIQPDEGHAMTHVGCAGSVASYGGINSAGLAMGHAVVPLDERPQDGGLPVAFLRRLALQHCATVPEAIDLLRKHDAWQTGDNLMFLDRSGEAAVVELAPRMQRVLRPAGRTIWCTNCFVHPDLVQGKEEARQRHRYIEKVLRAEQPSLTHALLQRLLSSHDDQAPLCRDSTQLSFIAHPVSGHLEIADGYPCQVGYREQKYETLHDWSQQP
jgi:predicted choloylglycine hydrolase